MLTDLFIPLVAVALAELGDKTQLSILLLSSKAKKHLQLLLGVMLAFLIVDGAAVLLGAWITSIVPLHLVKMFSGAIFIIIGALMLIEALYSRDKEAKKEGKLHFKNSFLSGFLLIFVSEWGDKTQIASALFASRYNALMVITGTMTALTLLSIMAIYLGKLISNKVDKKSMTIIAGIIFTVMGIAFILL
jgi:putative Ca2+/H+ antiporter (TMEM165/GDT1 family)